MSFYMNMALNEGEQAKEYLRRKEDQYKDDRSKQYNRYFGRYRDRIRDMTCDSEIAEREKLDPSLKPGIQMKNYRRDFPHAMPKTQSKSEKHYDNKINTVRNQHDYADRLIDKYDYCDTNGNNDKYDKNDHTNDPYGIQKAYDAAKRHYRRHVAKESGIFSECNFIEFAY